MNEWNRKEILHFIKALKKCKNLYDCNCSDYLNKNKKIDSYNYICNEMKSLKKIIGHLDVKKMIISLRNQFIKVKIAKEQNLLKAIYKVPKLWCYEQLIFLQDYVETDAGDISLIGNEHKHKCDDYVSSETSEIDVRSITLLQKDIKILNQTNSSFNRDVPNMNIVEKAKEIDAQLIEFIYTSGISFDLIESFRFRRLIQNLNSEYLIPKKRDILTDILDHTYEKYEYIKTANEKEGILLLYGIHQRTTCTKYVLACIQISNIKYFLQIWETEDDDMLHFVNNMLIECQDLARTYYNAKYYMIITDDPELEMVSPMWNTTCQTVIVEYFSYGILDLNLVAQIRKTLKIMEKFVIENLFDVNCPIILHIDKNWSTLRDMFRSYLKNIKNFRNFLIEHPSLSIEKNLLKFILDDNTLKDVQDNFTLLIAITDLINFSQNNKPLLAEITNLWLTLKVNEKHTDLLENSRNRALSIYALSANYLHPKFKGQHLSANQRREVEKFLNGILSERGKNDLNLYKSEKGIFKALNDRNILNSMTFWEMADKYHQDLAKIAKKLLICPSSLFELETSLMKFVQIHGDLRNILGLARFRKLAKIYFTLKFQENSKKITNLKFI